MPSANTITTPELVAKDCATWPVEERARWIALFVPRSPLQCPPWARQTAYQTAGVYTRYLAAVQAEGLPPAVTPGGVRVFIRGRESAGCTPRTISGYVWAVLKVTRLLHPHDDRMWLADTAHRIEMAARRTPKKKNAKVVDAAALSRLGKTLIAKARQLGPHAGWPAIQTYRDGLWLCLGVCAPERRRALATIKLGDIDLAARCIYFGPDDTKSRINSVREITHEVAEALAEWITVYRAVYEPAHDRLWIARGGAPACDSTLYIAMRKATATLVEGGTSPHRFRDGAATLLVEAGPEHAPLATTILTQSSERMTREYTETARRLEASRQVADILEAAESETRKDARTVTRSEIALSPRRRKARRYNTRR